MSFLTGIINSIKNFFSRLFKRLGPGLKKAIDIGVRVTDGFKTWNDEHGEILEFITKLIPGDVDDKVLAKINEQLPDYLIQMRLVQATSGLTDPAEIYKAAAATLQGLTGLVRSQALNDLSIVVAHISSDGDLDWDDAAYLLKWYYDNRYDDKVDTDIDTEDTDEGLVDDEEK